MPVTIRGTAGHGSLPAMSAWEGGRSKAEGVRSKLMRLESSDPTRSRRYLNLFGYGLTLA
ncbi:hypothetical protein AQJ91_18005 [Streptomyces dysideae]|uniref:Uncharacterized protein n=1 Tax=Streptomyces dysideae TaxID=909626 RepID=A0A124IEY2_9ACTN|nr:hypothetical protein AQJ91_18005 [Streptomyces dysideae]